MRCFHPPSFRKRFFSRCEYEEGQHDRTASCSTFRAGGSVSGENRLITQLWNLLIALFLRYGRTPSLPKPCRNSWISTFPDLSLSSSTNKFCIFFPELRKERLFGGEVVGGLRTLPEWVGGSRVGSVLVWGSVLQPVE